MPDIDFPCSVCNLCVDNDQNSICCDNCDLWVHLDCTDLTLDQFTILSQTDELFFCPNCQHQSRPSLPSLSTPPLLSPSLPDQHPVDLNISLSDHSSINDQSFSNHSSDFEFVNDDDESPQLRGLDFNSIPYSNSSRPSSSKNIITLSIPSFQDGDIL